MLHTTLSRKLLFVLAIAFVLRTQTIRAQSGFDAAPIEYYTADTHDAITLLIEEIESGNSSLEFDKKLGWLPAILEHFEIPHSSQTLVFSKTSLQIRRISPKRPRAIYFSDQVFVGFCQRGDYLEIIAQDPKQGARFYLLDQRNSQAPKFTRDQGNCLTCHENNRTQNVPGYLVRSVYPLRSGHPNFGSGTFTIDHRSPFEKRWGGWYVTGTHGAMEHLGNHVFSEEATDQLGQQNQIDLERYIRTDRYLTPHSDIVALMVLEHQTQTLNALTAGNFETRQALHQSFSMNKLLDRPEGFISESAARRIQSAAETIIEHLLFCNEFQLTDQVTGTSGFTEDFAQRGPFDPQHRSLREFNLKDRLFERRCSYLIYSPSFHELPEQLHKVTLKLLLEILRGENNDEKFAHLTSDERKEILEILIQTHPDF